MSNNFRQNNIDLEKQEDNMVVDLRALLEERENPKAKETQLKKEVSLKKTLKLKKKKVVKNKIKKKKNNSFFIFKKKEPLAEKLDFSQIKYKKLSSFNFKDLLKYFSYKKKKKSFLKVVKNREKVLAAKIKHFTVIPQIKPGFEKKRTKKALFLSRLPAFVIVLVVLVLPIKLFSLVSDLDFKNLEDRILNNSYGGLNSLLAAADSLSKLDFKDADSDLKKASLNFLRAKQDLDKINSAIFSLASLSADPKIKLASQGKKFLTAGVLASSLGENLLLATDSLFNSEDNFSEAFEVFIKKGSLAVEDAKELKKIIASIDAKSLPQDYRAKFEDLKNKSNFLFDNLDEFIKSADKLKDFLGLSTDKRYLLIFQNNTELRASGGFMGSYALVDIREGKIKNLEVPAGGSYDLEAGLKGKKFAPPYPLSLVNSLWNFWDANWWPDWPKTAKHLMWFYEQSSGPSVDAVISLTPTVIERLLEITGAIDMTNEYGLIIDSNNFWETVQKVVEHKNLEISHPDSTLELLASSTLINSSLPLEQDLENNPDNKPKKIIGDLMARLIEILPEKINQENLPALVSLFSDSAEQKHVLFYFKNKEAQAEVSRLGLAGEMKSSEHDYLMVVDTNIAGQKTDRVMEKDISLVSYVNKRGEIINNLTIKRYHRGVKGEALVGVRNVNWLRVYVPEGSKLLRASGFSIPEEHFFDELDPEAILIPDLEAEARAQVDASSKTLSYNEEGRTVFANWTMTDPSEMTELVITYLLPFNFYDLELQKKDYWWQSLYQYLSPEMNQVFPYSFLQQKQPGAKPFPFSYKIELPLETEVFWQKESQVPDNKNYLFEVNDLLDKDYFYGALIKKSS